MKGWMAVGGVFVAALAVWISANWSRKTAPPSASAPRIPLPEDVRRILEDRSQPWWNGHRIAVTNPNPQFPVPAVDFWGSMTAPPANTPIMPMKLAAHLAQSGALPPGHPLGERAVFFVDVRRRSEALAERIEPSLTVPSREVEISFREGALSRLDRRAIVVVYGSFYAHYLIVKRLRDAGFEAVYALEGGLEAWKSRELPLHVDAAVAAYRKAIEAERPSGDPPPEREEPFPGIEPTAAKILLDAGLLIDAVFVGDETTFRAGYIPGTRRVPIEEIERRYETVPRDRLILVYCGCCVSRRKGPSEEAVRRLARMGFTRLLHLDGHFKAWRDAGLPVEVSQ